MEALAVVEVLGRDGEVLRRERLATLPAFIGRGFDADLMLDDPYVAARHLSLDVDEANEFTLTDLGSINGFSLPSRSEQDLNLSVRIKAGETIRLGRSQIRVWHPDSAVATETLDSSTTHTRNWISFATWLFMAPGLMGLLMWVETTGPGRYGTLSIEFFSWAAVLLIWSGLWWMASRSSHHPTSYIAHGTVAASSLFITTLGLFTLNTVFFAFDLDQSNRDLFSGIVLGAGLAMGVYRHLRLVSRKSRFTLLSISLVGAIGLIGPLYYAYKANDLDKIGLMGIPSQLRLPWMRVVKGVSPEDFLNRE